AGSAVRAAALRVRLANDRNAGGQGIAAVAPSKTGGARRAAAEPRHTRRRRRRRVGADAREDHRALAERPRGRAGALGRIDRTTVQRRRYADRTGAPGTVRGAAVANRAPRWTIDGVASPRAARTRAARLTGASARSRLGADAAHARAGVARR